MRASLFAVMLFAGLAIGAKDCTGWGWSGSTGSTGAGSGDYPPQDKPWCLFDPPVGCRAECVAVNVEALNETCHNVSWSTQTLAFQDAVDKGVKLAMSSGIDLCTESDVQIHLSATPCQLGITPVPNPPESQDLCMNPAPNCANWP